MAFMLGEDIDLEIKTAFQSDTPQATKQEDEIRNKFREHKKLLIKHLNRKWDVTSLETYITHRIVPRGLRDRTIPAEHLHTENFLPKWKELCINHGLAVMGLIVEEEKAQLIDIKAQIEESARGLEIFKHLDEFTKQNDMLKKEIEKTQLNLKITKQSKFKRDIADFERDEIFDLTIRRGRSRSRGRNQRQQSKQRRDKSHSDSDDETTKTVTFLEQGGAEQKTSQTPPPSQKNKIGSQKQKQTKSSHDRTYTRSQKRH